MEAGWIILISLTIFVTTFMLAYYLIKWRYERRFYQWIQAETFKLEQEKQHISQAAISQSRAVLGGKFTEQLAPYLPEFKYDPTEARFIGSPIDMVVFPGLAKGDPEEIVIMEIKSGKHCHLTSQQKKIRQLIEDGMVRWEFIEHNEL
ncbi:MAG: Holliday junction resolvase [Dehalococcoidia bacterium]|nr:MAG: Holliday junction resolvase [Dehalococcoidia bacterium]